MRISTAYLHTLIPACLNGERKSQKELYNVFAAEMFKICVRYSKSERDAEEVLHDGFITLFKDLTAYNSEVSFESWVRKIFVNTAIEHLKQKRLSVTLKDGFGYLTGHIPAIDLNPFNRA